MLMCYGCNSFYICNVAVRVAESLSIYHLCVRLYCCLKSLKVVNVNDSVCDALCGKRMGYQIERTAVEVVSSHDMVAVLRDVLQGIGDSGCTRGNSKTGHTTLEGSHTVLKHALGRVCQSSVDITCITKTEAVCRML